jgi:hypothetical protein
MLDVVECTWYIHGRCGSADARSQEPGARSRAGYSRQQKGGNKRQSTSPTLAQT